MKTRCSSESLFSVIQGLSKEQKVCVKFIGFGSLLKMKILDVPSRISLCMLNNSDSTRMVIKVEKGEIMVTRESVNEMWGIPLGGKRIEENSYRDRSDKWYNDWAKQFDDVLNLRMTQLRHSIVSTSLVDMNFKMNFIVLFVNTLCKSSSSGICNINKLKHISTGTDIKNIDLCSYVLDCLIVTSNSFEPYNNKKNLDHAHISW